MAAHKKIAWGEKKEHWCGNSYCGGHVEYAASCECGKPLGTFDSSYDGAAGAALQKHRVAVALGEE